MNSDIAYPGVGGAVFAMVGIWSILGIGIYVWYLWALSRLFPYLGLPKAHGWIPVWNQWRLIERGGLPGWMVLLALVPPLGIVVLVVSIIAIHRINTEHDEGAGMTVLGAFIPPLWATLLGSRLRDRGQSTGAAPQNAQGATGAFAGRGLVEYGPNGQVYPLLNTNGGQVPVAPQVPGQQPQNPGTAMPPVPTMAPAQQQAQPAMPPAPVMPPAPAAPAAAAAPAAQTPSPAAPPAPAAAPVAGSPQAAPVADSQWSLGKTVDGNFERLANEEQQKPALDRLFGTNDSARPFSWPEPQPHAQVPPAPATPAAPPAPAQQPAPTFLPPAPPVQAAPPVRPVQQPAAQPAPAAPAAAQPAPAEPVAPVTAQDPQAPQEPKAPATAPTYAPPVQQPVTEAAPVVQAESPAKAEEPADDELDRTIVVSRKAAWVLELPDGRVLDLVGDDIVVGRKPTAVGQSDVLIVPDPTRTLSKSHARLRRDGDSWTIEDLNSTNGVFVFDEAGTQIEATPGTEQAASEQLIIGTLEVRLRKAE